MTACILVLGFVVVIWAAFLAITVALFMGSSVPAPKPVPTPSQVIWFRAVTKLASKRRSA